MAATILNKLEAARTAYYETDKPIMSDEEYDELVEKLRKLKPDHSFFNKPGPEPTKGKECLPVPMASLKKVKPDSWSQWRPSGASNGFVLSEKLDGISALWCSGSSKLYLRGDGEIGQNVSHCVGHIKGLQKKLGHWIIRGELICPSSEVVGTLARNWVNGILHQDEPKKEDLKKIRFVAYQVLEPKGLTRSQQFSWLVNQGFETAWHQSVPTLTTEILSNSYKDRRENSKYTCDGIVVGTNTVPINPTVKEPDDAVAYKEVSDDQCKETTVIKVDWAVSKTGTWIPRLMLEPVVIGSATIQFCTAFNGKYVEENKLGKGSTIRLRRSGDVIPVVDAVILGCATADMPPEGSWEWDESRTHCILKEGITNKDIIVKNLVHTVSTFGVEGFREATAGTLYDAGIKDMSSLLKTNKDNLKKLIGNVNGTKLWDQIHQKVKEATNETWILAAPCWPKGFGKSKLLAVYAVEPDITKWGGQTVKGMSAESVSTLKKSVPDFIKWREACGYVNVPSAQTNTNTVVKKTIESKGQVCMSGFRDSVMTAALNEAGYEVSDSVTKSTKALIVADKEKKTSKITNAEKYGVAIVLKNNVNSFFGLN